jgi:hypothetical protein
MQDTDAEMSQLLQDIHKQCPILFDSVLPRSEHESLRSQLDSLIDEDEVPLVASKRHLNATAIGCISSGYAQKALKLPVKISDLDKDVKFARLLREAYASEYGLDNIYEFGKKWLLWVKKLAFTDRYVFGSFLDSFCDFGPVVLGSEQPLP